MAAGCCPKASGNAPSLVGAYVGSRCQIGAGIPHLRGVGWSGARGILSFPKTRISASGPRGPALAMTVLGCDPAGCRRTLFPKAPFWEVGYAQETKEAPRLLHDGGG